MHSWQPGFSLSLRVLQKFDRFAAHLLAVVEAREEALRQEGGSAAAETAAGPSPRHAAAAAALQRAQSFLDASPVPDLGGGAAETAAAVPPRVPLRRQRSAGSTTLALLKRLRSEAGEAYAGTAKVLRMLVRNLRKEPTNPKFRSIKKDNKAVKAKVLAFPAAVEVLKLAGFEDDGTTLKVKLATVDVWARILWALDQGQ